MNDVLVYTPTLENVKNFSAFPQFLSNQTEHSLF